MSFEKASLPIAIFDSGVGGLTIVKVLKELYPSESIIYLADTASRPFGSKSSAELEKILKKNCEFLKTLKIKALLVACHTACSLGLEIYKDLNIPIFGITDSALGNLDHLNTKRQKVILATTRTINSNIYQNHLKDKSFDKKPLFIASSCIERLIETMETNQNTIMDELCSSLSEIKNCDNIDLLLACTHFPIYKKYIESVVGINCDLIDPAELFVESSIKTLEKISLKTPLKTAVDEYIVTADPELFKMKFSLYFYESLKKTNHFFNLSCAMI